MHLQYLLLAFNNDPSNRSRSHDSFGEDMNIPLTSFGEDMIISLTSFGEDMIISLTSFGEDYFPYFFKLIESLLAESPLVHDLKYNLEKQTTSD